MYNTDQKWGKQGMRSHLTTGQLRDSVFRGAGGWRDRAKKKKNSWTWTSDVNAEGGGGDGK